MIFWDSSALVSLIVDEPFSTTRIAQFQEDPVAVVWWATLVECQSGLQRRVREGSLTTAGASQARHALKVLSTDWFEVPPSSEIRQLALRLLRTHTLRAADSLQLAAALTVLGGGLEELRFASADQRLNEAAEIENLTVLA